MDVTRDLAAVLNSQSIDNDLNTADAVLAAILVDPIQNLPVRPRSEREYTKGDLLPL